MTPEEIIKNYLDPLEEILTKWIEGEHTRKMINEPEHRERYLGFVEGLRLSRANVIATRIRLEPQEEEAEEEEE
jgi:hypothetical protein